MAPFILPARRSTLLDPEQPKTHTHARTSSRDAGYASPRSSWNLDAARIINKLKTNRTFHVGGLFDIDGLPLFDDLMRYGVSEDKSKELACLEVERLVGVVNSAKPVQLEGSQAWFGQTDEEGYLRLDKLSHQIKIAIDICSHDLGLLMLEYDPSNAVLERFQEARAGILSVFDSKLTVDATDTWRRMKLEQANDLALHCVVNYLTSILARVLLRSMKGDFWDDNCIIALARTAAKMKIVAADLVHAAEISLAGKREWSARIARIMKDEPNPPTVDEEKETKEVEKQTIALARQVVVKTGRYFAVMSTFSEGILVLLSRVANAMGSAPGAALPPDIFESCSLVYDTGFRGHRALLCQERNGSIGASGSRDEVRCASFTFSMCLDVFESLASRVGSTTRGSSETATMIYWKWTKLGEESEVDEDADPRTGQRWLTSMSDLITAFIPYLMVCGPFSNALDTLTQRVMSIADPGDPVLMCAETRFLASFVVRASEYELFKAKFFGLDNDVASLARENEPIKAGLDMMASWTLDSDSIIIPSRLYCWGTMAFCSLLVVGGLAIGLTVKNRIEGVDPSNISVFCWTLAAFVILVMKALRVENWPWRDFFRGRVRCRSVSEVIAVTGINGQVFLSILLRLEPQIIMRKAGPFRGIFRRKESEGVGGGFSVDLPLTTDSMTRAGCFFIQVQSSIGPALVAIAATHGQPYRSVEPQSSLAHKVGIKCQNLQEPSAWGSGGETKNLYVLITNELKWSRVVGIFTKDAYFS
ncbi:hypothetical protein GQ53DRAFT_862337 [Thozetella sp. PMI_491]|nr:hypothetical protein GQ53DRAFT_862337 [Thozetella sp. PMI_491]